MIKIKNFMNKKLKIWIAIGIFSSIRIWSMEGTTSPELMPLKIPTVKMNKKEKISIDNFFDDFNTMSPKEKGACAGELGVATGTCAGVCWLAGILCIPNFPPAAIFPTLVAACGAGLCPLATIGGLEVCLHYRKKNKNDNT